MKLLIVESPGKIQKLQGILGGQWTVAASVGHVRDLPVKDIGVQAPNFIPQYEATEKGRGVLAKLSALAKNADEVYLATDPDREGEAIAWHLEDALGLSNPKRVTYTSITEQDVNNGIANARTIDMHLVKAQEGRRVLDRFCGYLVSMPLSNAVGERLSAGRVQSPAVRLIVERERVIRSFVSTTHYGVEFVFEAVENIQDGWKASWKTDNFLEAGQSYILDKALAEKVAKLKTLTVKDFSDTEKKQAPPAPFTTSSLQQAASNALKFDPKKTMTVAQKIYEGGHISYMRTDSPNLSAEAIAEIRAFCDAQGLPIVETPRTYKLKAGAQEGHEAIRPTHIEVVEIEGTADEKALYQLIRLRVLASQLQDAVFSVRTVMLESELEGKPVYFEAKGRTLTFEGWKIIIANDEALADDDSTQAEESTNDIPVLRTDSLVTAVSASMKTKKTQASPRFTQASLVRELEKSGIGRPATYASILENIMGREYVIEEKRKLHSTPLGEKLIDAMQGFFTFLDFEFTKNMENQLDEIAEGKLDYLTVVSKSYDVLVKEVQLFRAKNAIPCPACQGLNLAHKIKPQAPKDKGYDFWACADCKATFSNVNSRPGEQKVAPALTDFECEKCKSKLKHLKGQKKDGSGTYDFFACSNDDCKTNYDNMEGKPTAQIPKDKGKETEYKCKKCKKPLLEKPTKTGGVWFSCSGYPKCKERYWANEDKTPKFEG